jgi:transcriptional regulator with XRE-family HTH domain
MNGSQLKNEIKKRGFTLRRIAEEYGTSEQNFGRMLKSEDVSTKMMERAAEIMGISPADFYKPGDNITAHDHSTAFKGSYSCDQRLLDIIQTRDHQIEKLLAIIDRLSGKEKKEV